MQSDFSEKIVALENIFKIKIDNSSLFERALTHGSYTKENNIAGFENYERLEFLGDAVLKLCISDILYKKYPEYAEGNLTKIRSIVVSDKTIAKISQKIGLDRIIILGKQEEKLGGRKRVSILACAFEAVLGAYFLDSKFDEMSEYLNKIFLPYIKEVDENFEKFNAKAILQEYTQSKNKQIPDYKIVAEEGPSHEKIFVVEVSYMGETLATAKGTRKKEAEQQAAHMACVKLGVFNE